MAIPTTTPAPLSSSPSPRRLVLCFDGTGNRFQGGEGDTNIVKIYQMLERNNPQQYHYYQPGIGTYIKGQSSSSSVLKFWPKIKSKFITTVDQAVGTSFEAHITAGYKFIMRYHAPGDDIYIFGFSRGAYTARFLAEMLHGIGLLSRGNEEMIPFAYETFGNYQNSRGNMPQIDKDRKLMKHMADFKATFCRLDVDVHFLGLFDCVNSVGQFEIPFYRTSYEYIGVPAAKHIRHAVAIHERRLKFKPALFLFDKDDAETKNVDLKEVWFTGNHGDVGGGWNLQKGQSHLLSDTPLNWMVQEVLNLDNNRQLSFQTTNIANRLRAENEFPGPAIEKQTSAFETRQRVNQPHDLLKFGRGARFIATLLWWILEILPLFTRLELEKGKWIPRRLPPNLGAPRDIPQDAVIHESVGEMIKAGILDASTIPVKGGDNAHLPNTAAVLDFWRRLRSSAGSMIGPVGDSSRSKEHSPLSNGVMVNKSMTISNGINGHAP